MTKGRLLSDDLVLPDLKQQGSNPMDSSRILLGLITLARNAWADAIGSDGSGSLNGIISKNVLRNLLSALYLRDASTVRHSRRVARLAVGMAQYLSWEGRPLQLLEVSALLHDIGKIGIPDNILFKPGKLCSDEVRLMGLHQQVGNDVLQAFHVDQEVLDIIGQAHRHRNLHTQDEPLLGQSFHQGARILAVADAYDSLSNEQVYRRGMSHEEIMQILVQGTGAHFDRNVVSALARWIEQEGLPPVHAGNEPAAPGRSDVTAPPHELSEAASLGQIFSHIYLLENLYDAFYLLDSDRRILVWNWGSEKLFQHSADNVLCSTWTPRLLGYANEAGEPLVESEYPLQRILIEGRAITCHLKIPHPERNWDDLEVQTVPLIDSGGVFQGALEIVRKLHTERSLPPEYQELKIAASRDPLTSVANRTTMEAELVPMIERFSQSGRPEPFSLIFLDIDHFKQINDTYGHSMGDKVLVDVAHFLQNETYSGELVARYGGEEFVILCPGTGLDQAVRKAERLRVTLSNASIGELEQLRVTASFGVTEIEPLDTIDTLLQRADKALYVAKTSGRNRTCSLTSGQPAIPQTPDCETPDEETHPFLFRGKFKACVAADMIAYKLGGFVDDNRAKLKEVGPKRAVIRLGNRGLLPYWGASDSKRPVEIIIEIQNAPLESARRSCASVQTAIDVQIRPVGWVRCSLVFQERAKRVLKLLRSYFVGH